MVSKEEKLSFMSFSGVSCLLLLILFLMHLSELYSGLLLDLKNDLVVGQLPLLSFCLLTVNKSARQLFKLFLMCFAIQFTPHNGIQLCH